VLGRQHRGDALVGALAVVDQKDAPAPAGLGNGVARRTLDADLERVCARMRSSSVTIFSRDSERTRETSAMSLTGLVRKSSAPASRPATRSDGWSSAVTMTTGM
jgi:hypothetical protein